jgi:hypothetical protein
MAPLPRRFVPTLIFFILFPVMVMAEGKAAGVYMIAFRTSAHIARSGPEVFHGVAQAMRDYLHSKGVRVVADPERGDMEISDQMSVENMLHLAKQAGAESLLVVTVDRPAASWLKIKVESYDGSGKLLWSEEADKKSGMNGKNAPQVVMERLQAKLEPHVGKEGLPVTAEAGTGNAAPPPKAEPDGGKR